MNKKFIKHTGIVAPMNIPNIDTDTIIPKQFLQRINRTGFGKYLFYDWRYLNNKINKLNKKFILNQDNFKKSSILLTRENFGCGSSREHALWALTDYGIKIIISTSFADIFYINAINNRLLPITLKEKYINKMFFIINENPGIKFSVNLKTLTIKIFKNLFFSFNINSYDLNRILNGYDNINVTLKYSNQIKTWEKKQYDFLQ